MCGIAGLALHPGATPDPAMLAAMRRALAHRGPDGSGDYICGQAALVHTRLAIIDLATGDQPFFAANAALVANGEIYNHPTLRSTLPNTAFTSQSDCEPPLHLYLRNQKTFAAELRGMFAIAIADADGTHVTLVRDPFGIKPLYYGAFAQGIAFASEPQALCATGKFPRNINPTARAELLQLQFTSGAQTIFPGIFRLLPGETLHIRNGTIHATHRQPALPESGPETIDLPTALQRLDSALMQSVELHQRSDVPYGLFLSGGIDSAALLAAMARLNARPVQTFTAGFAAPGAADEREQAARMARSVGAHHQSLLITQDMVFAHLPEIVASMDDPVADYAIIPSWFLARHAGQSVKVVLSGEGGDEIFGGYGRYRSAMRPWYLGGRPMRRRGSFDGLGILRQNPTGWRTSFAKALAASATPHRSRLQSAQAADIADWLPHDLLTKLDRCLMAHAIEGRTPFLDPAIAAAGFCLPDSLKIRDGRGKFLLRTWLASALPAARPFAPKQGFTVPIGSWITQAGDKLGPLVAHHPAISEIAHPDRVKTLFRPSATKRQATAAWHLLFYALWHRAHIQNIRTPTPLLEALT